MWSFFLYAIMQQTASSVGTMLCISGLSEAVDPISKKDLCTVIHTLRQQDSLVALLTAPLHTHPPFFSPYKTAAAITKEKKDVRGEKKKIPDMLDFPHYLKMCIQVPVVDRGCNPNRDELEVNGAHRG